MATIQTGDDLFGVASLIVDPVAGSGTHTTIASALTAASSGQTIFIRPGTYTENITLKAGVNLTGFGCDSSFNNTGNVKIIGKCSFSSAGSLTISGIELQTNSDFLLAVTGSVSSIVNLNNCYLNCSNNTGISYTSSGPSSGINCYNCTGNLATTGIAIYSSTSAGTMNFSNCVWSNTGLSQLASNNSAGTAVHYYSTYDNVFSTSSTGVIYFFFCNQNFGTSLNATFLTTAGTGQGNIFGGEYTSNTEACISVGAGTVVDCYNCIIYSTNTHAITGAGTFNYAGVIFSGTTFLIDVSTQSGGTIQGVRSGNAPSAGFLGEQISSFVPTGSSVSLTSATAKTITSINLTAGVWDVSGLVVFSLGATTVPTFYQMSLSPTTNSTTNNYGDSDSVLNNQASTSLGTGYQPTLTVPSFRVTLASPATYYLVATCTFSVSTANAFGRISATRVG